MIAPTSFEIQGSKVCSTIRPLPLRHCFGWFQENHVWKAPTSTFHHNFHLPGLLQPVSRSKGPKCPRLSAPSLCATTLVGLKETMYGKPQPVPFTRTFFCQDCSNQFRDPRVQTVFDYPPPATGTTSTSWVGRMNGCQQAVQVQLQFISVPRMGIYTSLSVLPLTLRLRLRLCLVRGLRLGLKGTMRRINSPGPESPPWMRGKDLIQLRGRWADPFT